MQMMFDRNFRSSRGLWSPKTKILSNLLSPGPSLCNTKRKVSGPVIIRNITTIRKMPYTQNFHLIEAFCRRQQMSLSDIPSIWDVMQNLQIYELSSCITEQQLNTLHRLFTANSIQVYRRSRLLVCVACVMCNVFATFRYDTRHKVSVCNRCEKSETVIDIDMIGRVVYIFKTPFVLTVCCGQIVLYSGNGSEFTESCTAETCNHIAWSRHTTSSIFRLKIHGMGLWQIAVESTHKLSGEKAGGCWLYAGREFLKSRIEGQKTLPKPVSVLVRRCSMCKSASVVKIYTLLDVETRSLVVVPVCHRHTMRGLGGDETPKTLDMFLENVQNTR